jgi:hypothetical protein
LRFNGFDGQRGMPYGDAVVGEPPDVVGEASNDRGRVTSTITLVEGLQGVGVNQVSERGGDLSILSCMTCQFTMVLMGCYERLCAGWSIPLQDGETTCQAHAWFPVWRSPAA